MDSVILAAWVPGDIVALVSALCGLLLQVVQALTAKKKIELTGPAESAGIRVVKAGKWAALGGLLGGLLS